MSAASATTADAVGDEPTPGGRALPSLREIVSAAYADKRRIRRCMAAVMALSALLGVALPARYVAEASLVVLLGSEYTFRPEAGQPSTVGSALQGDQIMKAEVQILEADDLHEQAVRQIGLDTLYPDFVHPGLLGRARRAAMKWLQDTLATLDLAPAPAVSPDPVALATVVLFDPALDIEATKDANVITVSFRHKDAQLAARVVNTLVALYQQRRQDLFGDLQASAVGRELAGRQEALHLADERLDAFKRSHAISSFDLQRDLLLKRRDDLLRAVADSDASLAALRGRLGTLGRELARTPQSVPAYSEQDPDARTSATSAGLQDLRGKEAELATRFRPDSQVLADVRAQIGLRDAELRRLRADPSPSVRRQARNTVFDSLSLDQLHAQADLRAEEDRNAVLRPQLDSVGEALSALDQDQARLEQLSRVRDMAEADVRGTEKLRQDRQLVEAVAAQRLANVRVIQAARVPLKPRRLLVPVLAAGVALSLLVGLAVAVLSEALRRGVLGPEQLERRLGIAVLGSVPELGARAG